MRNTFSYNGDGQRVQKQDSTGTTKHVWDRQNILLETDGSNIIQVVYTLEPMVYGNLISQRRSGVTSFYLFDGLGSTTQLASNAGSVTDSYLYDSFGNVLLTGTTANPFKYVGQSGYYLDLDLLRYNLRARYYDPGSGRFLSRDPVEDAGIGLYTYVENAPSNHVDPSGLAKDCDKEHILCFRKCYRGKPPFRFMKKGGGSHYRYCQTKCLAEYMKCLAENVAEVSFATACAAANWIAQHPWATVGTIVVIGGVVFVVAATGGGGLILIPAAL